MISFQETISLEPVFELICVCNCIDSPALLYVVMIFEKGYFEKICSLVFLMLGFYLLYLFIMIIDENKELSSFLGILLACIINVLTIYFALRTFDRFMINSNGVKGSIHYSFHIKPVSFEIAWNTISRISFAPGTKLRFVLTICTNDNNTYQLDSDNIGKNPEQLLETLISYQYVNIEHYWKNVPIKEKDLIEYYHCVNRQKNGIYSYSIEPFVSNNSNDDGIDPFWKEYLLSRVYNTKHVLNVSNSLLKHIAKNPDKIEFTDFIRRTMVFCFIQEKQFEKAKVQLKLLSVSSSNKKYTEAELEYIKIALLR